MSAPHNNYINKQYLPRHLEARLKMLAQHAKVVLVTGARQVGKSSLLSHVFPQYPHITFDAFRDEYNVAADPDLFLENYPGPLILDEIQYQPALVSAIKRRIDRNDAPGQYFLTGSQNFSMLKNMSESLAGRVAILNLYPMSLHELHDKANQHWLPVLLEDPALLPKRVTGVLPLSSSLWSVLWRGGYPGLRSVPEEAMSILLQSYLQTYIERDVRLIENIKDLSEFDRFIRVLSNLSAQEIHPTQLGRELGLSHVTASRWLSLLKHTYQWHEIGPYHGNTLKRISNKNKGFFYDTGMACYLLGITSIASLGVYPRLGALFENYVVNQMMAASTALALAPQTYHWRTHNGMEVDLILERDGKLYPIEIKYKSSVTNRDLKGLKAFRESYAGASIQKGIIIYGGERCFQLDEHTIALPYHAVVSSTDP